MEAQKSSWWDIRVALSGSLGTSVAFAAGWAQPGWHIAIGLGAAWLAVAVGQQLFAREARS